MRKIFCLIITLLVLLSCNENPKRIESGDRSVKRLRDRLIAQKGDTIYKRKWLRIGFNNDVVEETEIYMSKFDTIMNQLKSYKNGILDAKYSGYYDLEILDTDRPHFYKGKITMHTVYENLKSDKANQRTLEFAYCQQSKDSMYLTYVESKTSNTIEFEFQNYFGRRLQGKLYELVSRDTIVKGEEMLNMKQTHLLVDNYTETVNLFLGSTADVGKKKFSIDKKELLPAD